MTPFEIIPVLDIKAGEVVRARAGDRAGYRPIETPLAATSRPADVLRGLLALAPFRTVYIADLDAIAGVGRHAAALAELRRVAPDVELWVDGGFATAEDARSTPSAQGVVPVFGSETLAGADALRAVREKLGPAGFVFSLDYRGDAFMGPPEVASEPGLWPENVILMTLDRVGMSTGADTARLRTLVGRAGSRRVFAAGGVRGAADIAALRAIGVAGALVATALHDGRLGPDALAGVLAREE